MVWRVCRSLSVKRRLKMTADARKGARPAPSIPHEARKAHPRPPVDRRIVGCVCGDDVGVHREKEPRAPP